MPFSILQAIALLAQDLVPATAPTKRKIVELCCVVLWPHRNRRELTWGCGIPSSFEWCSSYPCPLLFSSHTAFEFYPKGARLQGETIQKGWVFQPTIKAYMWKHDNWTSDLALSKDSTSTLRPGRSVSTDTSCFKVWQHLLHEPPAWVQQLIFALSEGSSD